MVAGTATNNFLDFSATRLVAISLIDADRGNDEVIGSVFPDTIQGGSGHDTLTGGGGIDTAVFSGSIDDCSITVNDNRVVVSDQVGGAGTDKLYDFSFLRFSDATFDLTGGSGGASPEAQNDTAPGTAGSPTATHALGNTDSPRGGGTPVAAH